MYWPALQEINGFKQELVFLGWRLAKGNELLESFGPNIGFVILTGQPAAVG